MYRAYLNYTYYYISAGLCKFISVRAPKSMLGTSLFSSSPTNTLFQNNVTQCLLELKQRLYCSRFKSV